MLAIGKRDGFVVHDENGYAGHIDIGDQEESFGILGHLDVVPVDKNCMEIEQIGGTAENYYGPDVAGINRFNLYYRYRTRTFDSESDSYDNWSEWKVIKENLKRQ